MESRADPWFQEYQAEVGPKGWEKFKGEIMARYDVADRDLVDEFKNLKQLTTVSAYQEEFENLKSILQIHNRHYTNEYFLSNFISGLKFEINCMVKLLKPTTLKDAISLAKMQKDIVQTIASQALAAPTATSVHIPHQTVFASPYGKQSATLPKPNLPSKLFTYNSRPQNYSYNNKSNSASTSSNSSRTQFPIKRLTAVEMQ